MSLTVSDLAGRVGLTSAAVRYYERFGLLPKPARNVSGYRQYEEGVADRLRFIKGAQRLGLRLKEIRELLEIRDRGLCPCGHTREVVRRRIAEVEDEIARLSGLRGQLAKLAEQYPEESCVEPSADGWPCEVEFIRKGR